MTTSATLATVAPAPASSTSGDRIWRLSRSHWLLLFAGWTVFGLIQGSLRNVLTFGGLDRALLQLVVLYVPAAWMWALLTPVIGGWDHRVEERTGSTAARVAAHLALFAVTAALSTMLRRELVTLLVEPPKVPFLVTFLFNSDLNAAGYLAALWAARALEAMGIAAERERKRLTLQEQVMRAQIEYLELQLRPHFIFNALGAIASLAHEAPRNAARMLRSLSALLESAIARHGKGPVALGDELEALEHYLAIQRVRFSDWLTIDQSIEPDAMRAEVPQFILQPLVENAVHHGLMQRSATGKITIRGHARDGRLVITVSDNGVGLRHDSYKESRGIGLDNLRARLRAVYGDAASLTLGDEPGGGTTARLDLPAKQSPMADPASTPVTDADGAQMTKADWAPATNADEAPIGTDATSPDRWRARVAAALAIGAALVFMRFQHSTAMYAVWRASGMIATSSHLFDDLLVVALWIVLAPIAWFLVQRFPLQRSELAGRAAVHTAAAFLFVLGHVSLAHAFGRHFDFAIWSDAGSELWSWDVSVYGLILVAAHYRRLTEWLRTRDVAAERLRRELQEARFDSAMVELRPAVLLDALQHVEALVTRNARAADGFIAEIAAFLRGTLDSGRHRTVALRTECDALTAYARVLAKSGRPGLTVRVELPETLAHVPVPTGVMRALLDSLLAERVMERGGETVELRVAEQHGGMLITASSPQTHSALPSRQLQEYEAQGLADVTARDSGIQLRVAMEKHA